MKTRDVKRRLKAKHEEAQRAANSCRVTGSGHSYPMMGLSHPYCLYCMHRRCDEVWTLEGEALAAIERLQGERA